MSADSTQTGADLTDGREAYEMRERGSSWTVVADVIGGGVARARKVVRAYVEHRDRVARSEQFALFDL